MIEVIANIIDDFPCAKHNFKCFYSINLLNLNSYGRVTFILPNIKGSRRPRKLICPDLTSWRVARLVEFQPTVYRAYPHLCRPVSRV